MPVVGRKPTVDNILVAGFLGAGIVFGLLREVVFAQVFGAGRELDVFRVAYSLPLFFSQALGTAFVSASVPWIVRGQRSGEYGGAEIAGRILRISILMVGVISFVGFTTVPLQIAAMAPGFSELQAASAEAATRVCWFMFFLTGLTFALRSDLNARDIFLPGASVSPIRNGSFLVLPALLALTPLAVDSMVLAWIAASSGIIVLMIHFRATGLARLKQLLTISRLDEGTGGIQTRAIYATLGSVLAYQALASLPRFLDRAYASSMEVGTVASVDYSYSVVMALGAVLGTAFNIVFLPRFVRRLEVLQHLRDLKRIGVVAVVLIIIGGLAGVLLFFWVEEFISAVFLRGAFDMSDLERTASIMGMQALGTGAMLAMLVFSHALIGMDMKVALIAVAGTKLIAKWISLELMVPVMGPRGIGASFIVAEGAAAVLATTFVVAGLQRKAAETAAE